MNKATNKVNFVLLGCGRIAKKHADILTSGEISGAKLLAVCDINLVKAEKFSAIYNIPAYTNITKLIEELEDRIDVISILTPSGLHVKHVCELAHYKKHFVVEKPMALNYKDACKMISTCKQYGNKLLVVKQNRFNEPIILLRSALLKHKFGKIIMGTCRMRWARTQDYYDEAPWRGTKIMDGGVFANQAIHYIDILQWMLGEAISVYAIGERLLANIEMEDTGIAIISFKEGIVGLIEATTACRPKNKEGSLSVLGSKGMVEIGGIALDKIISWDLEEEQQSISTKIINNNNENVYGFGHVNYLKNVVNVILKDDTPIVDGLEGSKSIKILDAIYSSINTKKEVYI